MRFEDKVVVVVGGNSGIGLAAALEFAREGARVVITGRNPETLAAAAERIGGAALAVQGDISDLAQTEALMEQVARTHGRIDVLFVNAGVGAFVPVEEVTESDWDRIVGINLKGPYFVVQRSLPLMGPGGSIVLTSSIGRTKALPGNSVYAASKAGLRAIARNLAAELVGRGIRVNSISPGPIETPLVTRTQGLAAEDVAETVERIREEVPMKRWGTPAEAASAVLFLASDDASFITGIDVFVDGGLASF